jgi:hypothetical protein
MKVCKHCEKELPFIEFYQQVQRSKVSNKAWRYYDSYCKNCRSDYGSVRRKEIKKLAVEFLGGKCVDCDLIDNVLDVYDFHHLDPSKKDFSFGKKGTRSFAAIKVELSKCVLLCSNCHRRRHAK